MVRSAGLGAGHVENWERTVLQRAEKLGGRPRSPGCLGWECSFLRKCSRNPVCRNREPLPSLPTLKMLCTHMSVIGTQLSGMFRVSVVSWRQW